MMRIHALALAILSVAFSSCGPTDSQNSLLGTEDFYLGKERQPDAIYYEKGIDYEIALPDFAGDNVPVYERAKPWLRDVRTYQIKHDPSSQGSSWALADLSESEAYDLYMGLICARLAPLGLNQEQGTLPNPIILGLRGLKPGDFIHNGNAFDIYNDTLVLLSIDGKGVKTVREYPVSTDPGAPRGGQWPEGESSYLFPTPSGTLTSYEWEQNSGKLKEKFMQYHYRKGIYSSYSVFRNDMVGYRVRENDNGNQTYVRIGSGHHIHAGAGRGESPFDAPNVKVSNNSAGCQVIYGQRTFAEFIRTAYALHPTREARYFLMDGKEVERMIKFNEQGKPVVISDQSLEEGWIREWATLKNLPDFKLPSADQSDPDQNPPSEDEDDLEDGLTFNL